MSFRHRNPQMHTNRTDGWPPRRGGEDDERRPQRRWTTRVLLAAPVVSAVAWLAFFVVQFGPTGGGAPAGKALFITIGISAAIALASGAYERTRAFAWLRDRLLRRRIDWDAFDEIRARWERRR